MKKKKFMAVAALHETSLILNDPVYKTTLVRTRSLSYHGPVGFVNSIQKAGPDHVQGQR